MRRILMKKVIDTIKSFFENNDWKYNFNDEDKVFSAGIDMGKRNIFQL